MLVAGLTLLAMAGSANAQENCTPVHFPPGKSSIAVHGVPNVGDDHPSMTFKTKAQTYKIFVGQESRSATRDPFTLTLSIRNHL
jgi:hypothetical protein